MEYNATKVKCKCGQTETATLYQYDYGQYLFFEGFDLPEVFEVHFSKSKTGEAVTVLGSDNAALIPDDLLQTAGKIHAWVYLHTTEDDGETEYHITIPVTARAMPTHETPTPVQQTEIEQLIATLEDLIENGDWSGGGGGSGGADGVSPTVTITEITGGHRVTITDADHPSGQTFDVMDGAKGEQGIQGIQGERGSDGADGKDGKDGINGTDGKDGTDGVSPTISVTAITGGHTVTITDAEHPNGISFNVMDGADGQNGQNGSDYVLTAQDKADIADLVLADLPTWTGGSY